jgi:hypothetical protein
MNYEPSIASRALAARQNETQLPASYVAARTALAECQSVDECKDWADKAAALAAYAKQAEDIELEQMAARIRARAMRRAGELLKQFQNERARTDLAEGAHLQTQAKAASEAGFSEWQAKNAVRIANIPQDDFDRQVEGNSPPTITTLADQGKQPRLRPDDYLKGRDPAAYNKALHFIGAMREYAKELASYDIEAVIPNLDEKQRAAARDCIALIDGIHDKIATRV